MALTLLDHSLTVRTDMTWVYLAGESNEGKIIKIGRTVKSDRTVAERLKTVNREQHSDERYIMLVAVRGDGTAEKSLHDYFAPFRQTRGSKIEYFHAEPELIEY